uniref:Symplekin C-terminal domain-containing protein n=1 Tax=Physcomitrium patens TaxID=3218 RepID=A0A2K1JJD5_PHYPA|nr:hypothetical protein PHYPA_019063 [Physcomitrium patens]
MVVVVVEQARTIELLWQPLPRSPARILPSRQLSSYSVSSDRSHYGRVIHPLALMKLFIDVELSPDEIPSATELFRILRALTDHVKTRDVGKLFQTLILRLEDGSQLDRVSKEIATLLTDPSEMMLEEFQAAFVAVVFNHELVLRQQSVVPFMFLLPRLPDQAKSRMREFLIPKVLKHLTVRRPVEASRMEFFAHAEAFATLVNLEFVPMNAH